MFEDFISIIGIDNIDPDFKNEAFIDIIVDGFSPVSGIKNILIRIIAQSSLTEMMQKDYGIDFVNDFTNKKSYIYSKQLLSVIREIEEESGIKYVPEIN
jgi:hypothetical protein